MVYLAGMDPSIMKVVDEGSFHATCEGFVEKRKGRMMEVWIARSALSAKINVIGGARTKIGPFARMMVSHD